MGAWFGSKAATGLTQAIVGLTPPHGACIETHLGGGAIMKRKPPALRNIGIDLDRRAIDSFSCAYPVELHHGCAHAFLSDFDFDGRELVCSDPPCARSTRRSQRRHRYDCTDADHVELLGILKSLPCSAMISGYPSRPCDEHLADWRTLEIQAGNQSCAVTEKPWFDFAPDRVRWHACAGRNFTDRQRIKRHAESWARRCRAMPPGERLAVVSAIMAVEAE